MLQYISVDKISPHPDNPRKDLGDLAELTESIKANGILQNLTVVPWFSEITRAPADDDKMNNTIDQAIENSIRADERRKMAAEVQQLLNDRMSKLNTCGPESPQRRVHQGGVVALTDVLIRLGVKP